MTVSHPLSGNPRLDVLAKNPNAGGAIINPLLSKTV
jgi:hypothetical protein